MILGLLLITAGTALASAWTGERDMLAAVNYVRSINGAPPLVLSE